MIEKIISGLLNFVIGLANLITAPIDLLISTTLPDLSDAIMQITNFFNLIGSSIGWCLSLVGFPNEALLLIVAFFVFKYAVVGVASGVKRVITLWYVLKP